jgi:hypothetical protein
MYKKIYSKDTQILLSCVETPTSEIPVETDSEDPQPIDYFSQLVDDDILQHIAGDHGSGSGIQRIPTR